MKKIISNIKKGIIVYTTYMLERMNKRSVKQLKENPKETFIYFHEIIEVSTTDIPDNWIRIKTVEGKIYYEDKSIINFTRIVENNSGFVFQKIKNGLAININHIKHKSNLIIIKLINGDIHEVNPRFKGRLKEAIAKIWEL